MGVTFFCAICTSDIESQTPRQAPLGKKGAMVNVCDDCMDGHAIEKRGVERGYTPQGGMLKNDELTRALRKAMGDEAYEREVARDVDYGHAPSLAMPLEAALHREHVNETVRRGRTGASRPLYTRDDGARVRRGRR